MKIQITMTIDTENDAFQGDGGYVTAKLEEIKRIMARTSDVPIRDALITGEGQLALRDTNGNHVGWMRVDKI
jgi:hypothetical protein